MARSAKAAIVSAGFGPTGPGIDQERERDRNRHYALKRFQEWAWPELFPQAVRGEKP